MLLLFLTSFNNTILRKCKAYFAAFHEPFSVADLAEVQESLSLTSRTGGLKVLMRGWVVGGVGGGRTVITLTNWRQTAQERLDYSQK